MTLDQAVRELELIDETRSYQAVKERWSHRAGDGRSRERRSRYSISMLPGYGGSPCSMLIGDTIDEVVSKARFALTPRNDTDTNEE